MLTLVPLKEVPATTTLATLTNGVPMKQTLGVAALVLLAVVACDSASPSLTGLLSDEAQLAKGGGSTGSSSPFTAVLDDATAYKLHSDGGGTYVDGYPD